MKLRKKIVNKWSNETDLMFIPWVCNEKSMLRNAMVHLVKDNCLKRYVKFEFNIKSREQSNQPAKKECCKQLWNVFNLQLLQCIVSLICDYRWEMYLYRDKKDDFAFNKYLTIHHNTVPFKTCAIKQKIYQIVFVHKLYCFLDFNKRYYNEKWYKNYAY